jgi:hypothetical protein
MKSIITSENQHTAELDRGNNKAFGIPISRYKNGAINTPHQNPRHKEHLNNSFKNVDFELDQFLNLVSMFPYFKIQHNPTAHDQ